MIAYFIGPHGQHPVLLDDVGEGHVYAGNPINTTAPRVRRHPRPCTCQASKLVAAEIDCLRNPGHYQHRPVSEL